MLQVFTVTKGQCQKYVEQTVCGVLRLVLFVGSSVCPGAGRSYDIQSAKVRQNVRNNENCTASTFCVFHAVVNSADAPFPFQAHFSNSQHSACARRHPRQARRCWFWGGLMQAHLHRFHTHNPSVCRAKYGGIGHKSFHHETLKAVSFPRFSHLWWRGLPPRWSLLEYVITH